MKKVKLVVFVIAVMVIADACAPKMSSVDKRKKELAKKKRKDPNDCPKLDCD